MADNAVRLLGFMVLVGASSVERTVSAQSVAVSSDHESIRLAPVTMRVNNISLEQAVQLIAKQAGVTAAYGKEILESDHRVTLDVRNAPAMAVFEKVLNGTGLKASIVAGRVVFVDTEVHGAEVASGEILGTVSNAVTKTPLRGAMIVVDDATKGGLSDDKGNFRVAHIAPGSHVVRVRLLGFMKAMQRVTLVDGQAVNIDIALQPSIAALDQVVVTGTVIPTELKAVPNAITVITAKQIEQRGITKIDQLFRGDVPGLFAQNQGGNALLDEVTMFSRGATALPGGASAGVDQFLGITNPIKTYVDGIELADSKYLSQIDPKSIERIEILTGPQASTIYGSNAMNGVMQIFTKRGHSLRPQLTLNLRSGWVENNFSNARTPQHDLGAQLNGIEGRLSYNAGGSWNYVGPWTPAKQTTRTGAFGGTRLDVPTPAGRVTADVTLRRTLAQNLQRGSALQTTTGYRETGWYAVASGTGLNRPTTHSLAEQTLGFTLGYVPTNWWSHELGLGQDVSEYENRSMSRGYLSRSDTALQIQQMHEDRRSLHYTATLQASVTSSSQVTVTAGADGWQSLLSSMTVQPQTLTGSLTSTSNFTEVIRQNGHNTGAFLQAQMGIQNELFLTYGLRTEWNPEFGAKAEPTYAPRYGVAYTRDIGMITAKLRASYGRSTRPPASGRKVSLSYTKVGFGTSLISDYGNIDYYLANPELAPEHQQGGEGGLELYWGTLGSFVVTRYNQVVDGLIDVPKADSARSLVPNPASGADTPLDANGYGYRYQYQYLNVGSIRNQGWELQGSLNTGPFTTRGTYSWTKSQTIGMNPKYRSFFTPTDYPQYQPGATFQYLPEHTWAVGVMYTGARTMVGLNMNGIGRITDFRNDFYFRSLSNFIRLPQNVLNMTNGRGYVSFNSSHVLADLIASYRFSSHMEGLAQIQNLTDRYTNDYYALYATIGRQAEFGVRLR